jgi:hypothetical protein
LNARGSCCPGLPAMFTFVLRGDCENASEDPFRRRLD